MKVRYTILAERVYLENESLLPIIISPLDAVGIDIREIPESTKLIDLEATLLTVWSTENVSERNSTVTFTLQILGPNGPNPEKEMTFTFGGFDRFLHRVNIKQMLYQGPGDYLFTVKTNGQDKAPPQATWLLTISDRQTDAGDTDRIV